MEIVLVFQPLAAKLLFEPCYQGNPLVNAMCVGLIRHDEIQKGQAKGVGNSILYVGAKKQDEMEFTVRPLLQKNLVKVKNSNDLRYK